VRVIATAGHVDHGKSSLVLALTGTDPDRFPEEKTRGLTIDLGFAFTTLPSGTEVGFVDVPGHVRFIKNMLAGVGAVDTALLVVAASEGWMPQSEEHLRILELLGVRHGMVALTKADAVDGETLELAQLEVDERLAESALAGAPIVVCDSLSGRGVDDVRDALEAVLADAPVATDRGRPRLWVDRVFSAKGAGTVVTGTLAGGSLAVDDEVDAGGHRARVRAIETAGRRVDRIRPGTRVALNLAGIEHRLLSRGDAVVRPSQWVTADVVDGAIALLPGEQLKRRGRYQAYVGSGEHRVWLRTLDDDGAFARLRFGAPVPVAPGDRLVLRDSGRGRTIAGVEILDVMPAPRAKDAPARLRRPLGERLLAARPWLARTDVSRLSGLGEEDASRLAGNLVDAGFAVDVGDWVVERDALERLRAATTERVVEHHRARPHEAGVEIAALARAFRVTPDQVRAALRDAADLVLERGIVRHVSHTSGAADSPEARKLLEALEAAPFDPPAPHEVGADAGLVRRLVRDGLLVDVDGIVFAASALATARGRVIDALRSRGSVTVADVRDLLGSTRKYVVPIVTWLDREGVTRRRGDDRFPGPTSGLTKPSM